MKRAFIFFLAALVIQQTIAQTTKFDNATYTAPKGWKKDTKQGVVIYSKADTTTGGFCMIALYAATVSTGNAEKDFTNEWNELAVTPFSAESNPAKETVITSDGWNTVSAASTANQDNVDSYIVLTVFSGFGKTTSVLANLNDQTYITELDKFLASIKLDKKAVLGKKEVTAPVNNTAITGKWGKSSSSPSAYVNGVINNLAYSGYTKGQYDFKANGNYTFQGESWGGYLKSTEYRLIDENGKYSVNGNQLTIIPEKSLYRVVDKSGALKKSQNIPLAKRNYSWQTHYYEGIQETNLILTATAENPIDGKFTSSNLFAKSFLYGPGGKLEFNFLPLK